MLELHFHRLTGCRKLGGLGYPELTGMISGYPELTGMISSWNLTARAPHPSPPLLMWLKNRKKRQGKKIIEPGSQKLNLFPILKQVKFIMEAKKQ